MSNNRKPFSTRLDADLIKKLRIQAAEEERPINDLLEEAIQAYLEK